MLARRRGYGSLATRYVCCRYVERSRPNERTPPDFATAEKRKKQPIMKLAVTKYQITRGIAKTVGRRVTSRPRKAVTNRLATKKPIAAPIWAWTIRTDTLQ